MRDQCVICFPSWSGWTVIQCVLMTSVAVGVFLGLKSCFDHFRRQFSKIIVVVIGGGPIGLLSALIASKTGNTEKIIVFEENSKSDLISRPQQIGLDIQSVKFLRGLGIDFDNIEGCWDKRGKEFFTPIGVFQEYVLDIVPQVKMVDIDFRFGTKVL